MPGRNLVKTYVEDAYYHVYNRGVNKEVVFHDTDDYAVFLNLLKRYLDEKPSKDNKGREYPWLGARIELLSFCLMPNHYHLLIFQHDRTAMTELIRAVSTSFGMYYNKKYKRVGPVFQSRFKASLIDSQAYLDHVSRYIHLNPGKERYQDWAPSSYQFYKNNAPGWVKSDHILEMFPSAQDYLEFIADYEAMHDELEVIKHELANE
jgi:putative transposase